MAPKLSRYQKSKNEINGNKYGSTHESDIRLEAFSFQEESDGIIELNISETQLNSLDLFIGNNSQGKSRLFRTFEFVNQLTGPSRRKISSNFTALFKFNVKGKPWS